MLKLAAVHLLFCSCLVACTSSFTFTPNNSNASDALPAQTLSLTGFPGNVVAGQQGNLTLTAYDSHGHVATGYTSKVQFISSDLQAVLPSDYVFTAKDAGVHTFTGTSLRTADGNAYIRAVDSAGTSAERNAILVDPAEASQFALVGPAAASAVAGQAIAATLIAQDLYGNTATNYAGTVHFNSSDLTAIVPLDYTFDATDAGQHAYGNAFVLFVAGQQNVTVSDDAKRTGTLAVHVAGATAQCLTLTMSDVSVAGAPMTVSLAAYDAYANHATDYRGTVVFTSSDPFARLPDTYTFSALDQGSHGFSANATVLQTAGTTHVTVSDANADLALTSISPGEVNVTVSPNVVTHFVVQVPAWVQPALPYNATVSGLDAYGNLVPRYAGTVNLTSSDTSGTPPTSPPLPLAFTGSGNGSIVVNNLRLKALGPQTLTATDSGTASITGTASTMVQAQNFAASYYFNSSTQADYVYDANLIVIDATQAASLKSIYTAVGDSDAASFGAGESRALQWDSNDSILRLASSNDARVFYSMLGSGSINPTWNSSIDSTNRGSSNVSGVYSNPNTFNYYSIGTSVLFGGVAGGGNTYAYMKLWDLSTTPIIIDANSYVSYAIYPQDGRIGVGGSSAVNGNNSLSTAVNLVFTDGTDLAAAAVTDANGVLMNPSSQGMGGHLVPNTWNYVHASLAPLAGKVVDHIALG